MYENFAIFAEMEHKKTLTVGYDAKRAFLNGTGLGNYSRRVIESVSRLKPEWCYKLFTPRVGARDVECKADIVLPERGMWKPFSGLWRVKGGMTGAIKREGVDLFHGLSNELPLDIEKPGIPSVLTFHDVIYRRCPDNYSAVDRKIYDFKYGRSARNATRIIAISECTKRDVVEFYQVDPQKVDVIYQSCHPQFSEPVHEEKLAMVRQRYSLPNRYIAMVGTVERRKNQMLAVEALPMIDPEVRLVIVGRSRQKYGELLMRRAAELGVSDRLVMLDGLPFGDLPAVYAMAEVAAYVSRYEGFGLPVIEAIESGTPVIAATGSCLEEAGGPGAVYVNPDDAERFAESANRLLGDAVLRAETVAKGRDYVARLQRVPMEEGVVHSYLRAIEAYNG